MSLDQAKPKIVIIGAGGHAASVANVALSAGYQIECFIHDKKGGQQFLGYPVHAAVSALPNPNQFHYAIGVGDNAIRETLHLNLTRQHKDLHYPVLIHASAVISSFCTIGEGCILMPGSVLGPNSTMERFSFINTSASVDHDCVLHAFSSIAPGSTLGGKVSVGDRAAVSIGAVVKDSIRIGRDAVLGANSYLNTNQPESTVAYGSPAKVVRGREWGESYL
jgi:sugar O-acyltransferase (sialic acid O-acetyltransferase NeuD family)